MRRRARYSWKLDDSQEKRLRMANQEASRTSSPTTIKGAKMMARNELLTWIGESCPEAIFFGKSRSCIDLLDHLWDWFEYGLTADYG